MVYCSQIPDSIPKPDWYIGGMAHEEVNSRQQHTRELVRVDLLLTVGAVTVASLQHEMSAGT